MFETEKDLNEIASHYDGLSNLMEQEHGLTLTISEMDDIIQEAQKVVEKFPLKDECFDRQLQAEIDKLPYVKHLDDGMYNNGRLDGFIEGARWRHELVQSENVPDVRDSRTTQPEPPQLAVGTILIAKDVCKSDDSDEESLIIGKEYPIAEIFPDKIRVKTEHTDYHYFHIATELAEYYYGTYFDIKQ
jgi:hypothetical protein